jgi:hypothetical protein
MRKNRGKILNKIQDVMGIKNGKYCSSDVNVVSLNGDGGKQLQPFGDKPEVPTATIGIPSVTIGIPSVTYVNCPNGERKTIDFNEIQMNNNIIPDCVLGGSVILNDLNGYVVNYGETICPVDTPNVKSIQGCESVDLISIDFGDNIVSNDSVYQLSFNGVTQPGCYTIIKDDIKPSDTVSSVQGVPDCSTCRRVAP